MTRCPFSKQYKDEENQQLKCEHGLQYVHVHKPRKPGPVEKNQEMNNSTEKQDECKIISTVAPHPITILHNKEVSINKELQETRLDVDTAPLWLEYKAQVKDVLNDFAGETTAHGYKRTISTRRAVHCK